MIELEQAIDLINAAMQTRWGKYLSDVEAAIIRGAWQNQTYFEIADAHGYSTNYLTTTVGPKLWRQLSQALGEPVSKTSFRSALERHALSTTQRTPTQPVDLPSVSHIDWGEAPDASHFYGRTEELNQLQQWISGVSPVEPPLQNNLQQCRLVALLGMGGIGKTALAVKLVNQLQTQFEWIIWRSLRNAPSLEKLLSDWVLFLSQQQDTQADLSRLLYYLRSRRCLLILDNSETIFQEGDRAGHYRLDYENYGELFKLVGETIHTSCLVLTSREKPAEVAALEDGERVRSLHLVGSTEAAQQLIEMRELQGSYEHKKRLANCYGNNPLAIKIITSSIKDLFDGDIEKFLGQNTILFNGLRRLLEQQFERLSHLEKTVMYWLAINRNWTTIAELAEDIAPAASRASLLEALESLTWRSLIEKQSGCYTQQPVVMEYVTDYLTEQIATELVSQKLFLFDRLALIKTTVKDYIRQAQARLILEPVVNKLRVAFNYPTALEYHLKCVLEHLRQIEKPLVYSGGNLINLFRHLQISLEGCNFSELAITHADLRGMELHCTNFQNAVLAKSTFTQTLGVVFTVTFSPDGQILAAGDDQGKIYLWRMADGQPIFSIQAHDSWIKSIAWNPNGQTLATSSADGQIKLWNPRTGECERTFHGHTGWIRSIAWHGDGQRLASGSVDQTVRIWEMQTGCSTILSHQSPIWAVVWSPNGEKLASGADDGVVKIWDVKTGECLTQLPGHANGIKALSWNQDGRSLASGSDDQTVKLWDIETGFCLRTLQGHSGSLWSITESPDGEMLATSSHDHTVRVWNSSSGQCLQLLQGHTNWVWSVCWSPDGEFLATGSQDQTIKLWSARTGECLRTLQGYISQMRCVSFSPAGNQLASGSMDSHVRLWNLEQGNKVKLLRGHQNEVWALAWSPDGQLIASAAHDQTVRVWDSQKGDCLRVLRGHTSFLWSVAWSPNGQTIASTSADLTVRLWNVQGDCIRILNGHLGWVFATAWSPDGHLLATSGADNVVRLWNPQTGECVMVLVGHSNWVWSLVWSPHLPILASSSGDTTIRIWHTQTGKCIQVLEGQHTHWVSAIAWSSDGQFIASGSADQTVQLWDVQAGKCVQVFKGHTRQITAVSWRADGKVLASSSEDETLKLWDVETGNCLQTLRAIRPYEGMNMTGVRGLTEAQIESLKALGAFSIYRILNES